MSAPRPRASSSARISPRSAHKLDPTRKVTAAICAAWDHPGQTWKDMQPAFTYLDVGGYNYQWPEYEKDHATYPDRIMVGTESFPNQSFQNWRAVEADSWVLGDFIWTAIDYLGESGIGHASIHNGPGPDCLQRPLSVVQLLLRRHRPHRQQEAAVLVPRRGVATQQSRNGRAAPDPGGLHRARQHVGLERRAAQLDLAGIRGNAHDRPRLHPRRHGCVLLLNGKQVGSKDLTEKDALRAEFTVPWAPGELEGRRVSERRGDRHHRVHHRRQAQQAPPDAGPPQTQRQPRRPELRHGPGGRRPMAASIPDAVVPVSFSLTGAGELAAVGNGNPKDVASFRQPHSRTFQGACVAIIRPTGNPGAIQLRAQSPNLEPATLELEVSS